MKKIWMSLAALMSLRAAELPPAALILDRFAEAVGGEEKLENPRPQIITVRMEGGPVKGRMTMHTAPPNLLYMVMDLGSMKMEMGSDGTVVWMNSDRTGAQVLPKGAGLATGMELDVWTNWRKAREGVTTVGESEVEGEACWEVEKKSAAGTMTTCYGKGSGLALRMVWPTGMATVMSDYRMVEGIRYPHRSVQKVQGEEVVGVVEKLEFPAEVDRERFALPAAVRALLAGGARR